VTELGMGRDRDMIEDSLGRTSSRFRPAPVIRCISSIYETD